MSDRNDSLGLSVAHESHLTNRTFPGPTYARRGGRAHRPGPTLLAVLCDHSGPVHRDPGSREVTV